MPLICDINSLHNIRSMHLHRIDVSAIVRKSLRALAWEILGTGITMVFFHAAGTKPSSKKTWNNLVQTCPSCSAHSFNTMPSRPSGPVALCFNSMEHLGNLPYLYSHRFRFNEIIIIHIINIYNIVKSWIKNIKIIYKYMGVINQLYLFLLVMVSIWSNP